MRILTAMIVALAGVGCTGPNNALERTEELKLKRAHCEKITEVKSCEADTADGCHWSSVACAAVCQIDPQDTGRCLPCPVGACEGPPLPPPPRGECSTLTDASLCQADGCVWQYSVCPACPACPTCGACAPCESTGACVDPAVVPPPDPIQVRDGGVASGCACPNGEICVQQVGGPPVQGEGDSPAPITCEKVPDSCVTTQQYPAPTPCHCFNGGIQICSESPSTSGLCICDNGIR